MRQAFTIALFLFATGCASMARQDAEDAMKRRLDPLLGMPMEAVVQDLGAPESTQQLGELTVLHYFTDQGNRTKTINTTFGAVHKTRRRYDSFDLFVRAGTVQSWKGEAVR